MTLRMKRNERIQLDPETGERVLAQVNEPPSKRQKSPQQIVNDWVSPIVEAEKVSSMVEGEGSVCLHSFMYDISSNVPVPLRQLDVQGMLKVVTANDWIMSKVLSDRPAYLAWTGLGSSDKARVVSQLFSLHQLERRVDYTRVLLADNQTFCKRTETFGEASPDTFYGLDMSHVSRSVLVDTATPLWDGMFEHQGYNKRSIEYWNAICGRQQEFPQMCGDPLLPMLVGAPRTGKTTIQTVVQEMIGGENLVEIFHSSQNRRFVWGTCETKNHVMMTELQFDTNIKVNDLLAISNLDEHKKIERKGVQSYNVIRRMPAMVVGNTFLTRVINSHQSLIERVVWFPFMFRPASPDRDLAARIIAEEGPALVRKWTSAWVSLRNSTNSIVSEGAMGPQLWSFNQQMRSMNEESQQETFFEDVYEWTAWQTAFPGSEWRTIRLPELMSTYSSWCKSLSIFPSNNTPVSWRAIIRSFGLKYDTTADPTKTPTIWYLRKKPRDNWFQHPNVSFILTGMRSFSESS